MAQSEQGRSVSADQFQDLALGRRVRRNRRDTPLAGRTLDPQAALFSTAPRRKRWSIAPETAQNTPRDRILINKISSLQWHRVMGVMKRVCKHDGDPTGRPAPMGYRNEFVHELQPAVRARAAGAACRRI